MTDWIAVLRHMEKKLYKLASDSPIDVVAWAACEAAADELERQRDAAQGTEEAAKTRQPLAVASDMAPSAPASSEREALARALRAAWAEPGPSPRAIQSVPGDYGDKWLRVADEVIAREAALRAQLAEREAELAALRSSERERLISEVVAQSSSCFPYNRDVAANALVAHERAHRAKETL